MKYEKLNESLNKNSDVTLAENDAVSGINLSVPGWSGLMHYVFFRELLRALIGDDEKRVSILMLGVYRGRDLRYISCAYHEVELFNRHRIAAGLELIGVDKFNELCKKSVFNYIQEWEKMTARIGFWVDLDTAYVTYTNDYIESVWWILKNFWEKDLLFKGYKIVPYCPRCGTPRNCRSLSSGSLIGPLRRTRCRRCRSSPPRRPACGP